jgi:hypothetical protein
MLVKLSEEARRRLNAVAKKQHDPSRLLQYFELHLADVGKRFYEHPSDNSGE